MTQLDPHSTSKEFYSSTMEQNFDVSYLGGNECPQEKGSIWCILADEQDDGSTTCPMLPASWNDLHSSSMTDLESSQYSTIQLDELDDQEKSDFKLICGLLSEDQNEASQDDTSSMNDKTWSELPTLQDLEDRSMLSRNLKSVCNEIGIGVTRFKKHMRKLGLKRWPQRHLASMKKLRAKVLVRVYHYPCDKRRRQRTNTMML